MNVFPVALKEVKTILQGMFYLKYDCKYFSSVLGVDSGET